MPVRPAALLVAAVLLGTACADDPAAAPGTPLRAPAPAALHADPPGERMPEARSAPEVDDPVEVTLVIPVGTMPDGTEVEVVVREVVAGGRREVRLDTPAGVVDHHVVDGDEHWWWIPPMVRDAAGGVEWVHLDVAEAEAVGELPDPVADARVPLPRPGGVEAGLVVAGYEVTEVERVDARTDRLVLDGLEQPAVLTLRALAPGTRIELPVGATELRDLPEAVGR